MKFLYILFILFLPVTAFAAEPFSSQPANNPVPYVFGAGRTSSPVALPPTFPQYLPNGAINLDEAWIQKGGARLYWNTIIIPRQLKMGGASWVDPALVPLLIQEPAEKKYKRTYKSSSLKKEKGAISKPAAMPQTAPALSISKDRVNIPQITGSTANTTIDNKASVSSDAVLKKDPILTDKILQDNTVKQIPMRVQ